MATNTGFKQAVIAYSVDAATGRPLDASGNFSDESGRPQAVMLLAGTPNPDPVNFEVVGYFAAGARIDGEPTRVLDTEDCPTGASVPWILTTGFWDDGARWINSETWNY